MGGDPVATAWYNSLSASLPRGEAFFVEAARAFRDELPSAMQREIQTFIRQEINHTREHVAFNCYAEEHGYDIASIDKGLAAMLTLADGRPKTTRTYEKGLKVSDAEMASLSITGDAFHPAWNYTTTPRRSDS